MSAARNASAHGITTDALQHAIFTNTHFLIIATDEHGVVQIFNEGAQRMLEYTEEDVVGRITPADICDSASLAVRAASFTPTANPQVKVGFDALVAHASRGIEENFDLTFVCKDGSRLTTSVSVAALRDAGAGIIGYLLIGTDSTERQRAEAAQ